MFLEKFATDPETKHYKLEMDMLIILEQEQWRRCAKFIEGRGEKKGTGNPGIGVELHHYQHRQDLTL